MTTDLFGHEPEPAAEERLPVARVATEGEVDAAALARRKRLAARMSERFAEQLAEECKAWLTAERSERGDSDWLPPEDYVAEGAVTCRERNSGASYWPTPGKVARARAYARRLATSAEEAEAAL